MRIGIVQIQPAKGQISVNINRHLNWIEQAADLGAELIVFPELSLTGYEPALANELALDAKDPIFDELQEISDHRSIAIGVGMPTLSDGGVRISMLLFQEQETRQVYAKQLLHQDEVPYFMPGEGQLILAIGEEKIAPAICYESLQYTHAENAHTLGAGIYLASVAKSQQGIRKAYLHYPEIAKKFQMPVLMVNSIGYCDNFLSAGQSAVWDDQGILLSHLGKDDQGILIFDSNTNEVVSKPLN
ncbi:MAG: carbon-nitrogen hydrolase family protein [Saprospiraceae bacterium]|nr:carbon-nitrogen hydrolase family protein [Saprospiraceae bacterium]